MLINKLYLYPLRRNEPIDFRYLPVEVAHNLVLLLAGRDGNSEVSYILKANRLPYTTAITIEHFLGIIGVQ